MKKVLVVIDVQNDFISGSLGSVEAQKKIENIVKKIESKAWDCIIVTQDTHDESYLETKEGQKLPVKHCIRKNLGWEIEPRVYKALNNFDGEVIYIEKPTFGSMEVPYMLKQEEMEIEVVGFCTDICVISNVLLLKAAFYDVADIIVDSECCAGVTIEKHLAALEVMRSCQIEIK